MISIQELIEYLEEQIVDIENSGDYYSSSTEHQIANKIKEEKIDLLNDIKDRILLEKNN